VSRGTAQVSGGKRVYLITRRRSAAWRQRGVASIGLSQWRLASYLRIEEREL